MTAHATDPHLSPSEELDRLIDAGRLPSAGLMDQALRNAANEGGHLDATVVRALCQHLEESAQLIADHPLTQGGIDRTDAFRYLLSLTAFAIDWGILSGDPFAPMFSPAYPAHRLDWGAANPDGVYRKVLVRDDCAYLIRGRMGNARYFSLDFRPTSHNETVTPADLNPDQEGRFEMYVGGGEQGRWWPMQAGTHAIVDAGVLRQLGRSSQGPTQNRPYRRAGSAKSRRRVRPDRRRIRGDRSMDPGRWGSLLAGALDRHAQTVRECLPR